MDILSFFILDMWIRNGPILLMAPKIKKIERRTTPARR
jgi:hypothetical protein